jgi:small subunit ribosomal protein S14
MAKQGMIQREKKRELLTLKYITKRTLLKNELKAANTYSEKLEVYKKLQKLPKNSAPVRKRNRCWATGRSRAFYRDFGLSRHVLREMAHEGLIPGLRKASW